MDIIITIILLILGIWLLLPKGDENPKENQKTKRTEKDYDDDDEELLAIIYPEDEDF